MVYGAVRQADRDETLKHRTAATETLIPELLKLV
jgi:hypothetical protein